MTQSIYTAYLAPKGREDDLTRELGDTLTERHGQLFLCESPPKTPVYFAQNIWYNAQKFNIASIKDASKQLRAIQRNWVLYHHDYHRRAKLIAENLPHVSAKRIEFGAPLPDAPLGSWCLLEKDTMLAASHCEAAVPHGAYEFVEDKDTPPNRAYLKLWEVFAKLGVYPKAGERAIDVGSSPGGWTWVLQQCGAHVISVDKAELDPKIAKLPNIEFLQESAFGLDPLDYAPMDWLCSDIICYPMKLFELVMRWIDSGTVKNMVCTIKLLGETDFDAISQFASIPNSRIMHLYNNKHELTWIWRTPT